MKIIKNILIFILISLIVLFSPFILFFIVVKINDVMDPMTGPMKNKEEVILSVKKNIEDLNILSIDLYNKYKDKNNVFFIGHYPNKEDYSYIEYESDIKNKLFNTIDIKRITGSLADGIIAYVLVAPKHSSQCFYYSMDDIQCLDYFKVDNSNDWKFYVPEEEIENFYYYNKGDNYLFAHDNWVVECVLKVDDKNHYRIKDSTYTEKICNNWYYSESCYGNDCF